MNLLNTLKSFGNILQSKSLIRRALGFCLLARSCTMVCSLRFCLRASQMPWCMSASSSGCLELLTWRLTPVSMHKLHFSDSNFFAALQSSKVNLEFTPALWSSTFSGHIRFPCSSARNWWACCWLVFVASPDVVSEEEADILRPTIKNPNVAASCCIGSMRSLRVENTSSTANSPSNSLW